MTVTIQPTDWPKNMSADDRKVWLHKEITKWVGEKKIQECLSALELGNLSMTEKAVAYRSILIVGGIRHCRIHARAEARMPILTLITYLSDNAQGVCSLSITKFQQLLNRSRPCIVENILALEAEGLIGVERIDGMPNRYWPRIPAALAEMSPNPVWVVDAILGQPKQKVHRTVEAAIASATESQATAVNQSIGVNQYQATAVNQTSKLQPRDQLTPAAPPVNSSTHSISSLNLFSSSQEKKETAPKKGASATRGSRLPADWLLPEDWRTWTLSAFRVSPHKVQLEADKFRDYWHAKAGSDATKVDWAATWRGWCRRGLEKFAIPSGSQPMTAAPDPEREAYYAQLRAAERLDP
jgi:hypothetical protein